MTHGSTVLFVSLPVKARVYAVGFAPAAAAGGGAYTHAWTVSAQVVAGRAVGAVTRHWILRQACQPECNRRELRAAAETCLSTLGVKFTFTVRGA